MQLLSICLSVWSKGFLIEKNNRPNTFECVWAWLGVPSFKFISQWDSFCLGIILVGLYLFCILYFVFDAGNAIYLYVGVHSLGAEKVICFQNHMASFYSNSPHYPSCSALESGEFVLLCQFPKCSVYSFLVFIISLFSNVSLTICQVVIASIVFCSWCAIFS